MTKNDLNLLYEYDRWANNRVLQACHALSEEQLTRDLGGAFASVRDTFVHVLAGEWGWLQYWKQPLPDAAFVAEMMARRKVLFDPAAFPNVEALQQKWAEVEKEQIEFVHSVADERLQEMIPVRATRMKLIHLMQHVANHSTYHRGQIALMFRQVGAVPLATDFHVFVMENEAR